MRHPQAYSSLAYQVPDNMAKEEQTLFEVQKEKESAISAGDFEQAKELQARQQELGKIWSRSENALNAVVKQKNCR